VRINDDDDDDDELDNGVDPSPQGGQSVVSTPLLRRQERYHGYDRYAPRALHNTAWLGRVWSGEQLNSGCLQQSSPPCQPQQSAAAAAANARAASSSAQNSQNVLLVRRPAVCSAASQSLRHFQLRSIVRAAVIRARLSSLIELGNEWRPIGYNDYCK